MSWEKAKVLDNEIQYEDLAKWLKQIHYFALLLSQVKIVIAT